MYATEVHRTLRTTLKGSTELMAIIKEVYDVPPENPVFPFITTGESQSYPVDSMTGNGMKHVVSINCWSSVSKAQCRTITETIHKVLNAAAPIALPAGNRFDIDFEQIVTTFEPENRLFRGMIRFAAIVYPQQ